MTPFNATAAGLGGEEWSFHIHDAGEPPSMLVTSVWLFVSLCVAVLFLVVRPAATRRVQHASPDHSPHSQTGTVLAAERSGEDTSRHAQVVWQLLSAVWTLALYDVVHRTCCYLQLSPYMLARHQLLPLGGSFLVDGLWTEWVNWVRLYVQCGSSLSSAAATRESCVGWQLPLAGVLDYRQYPEYAALNTSRPPSSEKVDLYHRMAVEALVVTAVMAMQLHSLFFLVRHIFFAPRASLQSNDNAPGPEDKKERGTGNAPATGDEFMSEPHSPDFTTARKHTDAPGDDSWVDSPEALAAEEAWRSEESSETRTRGAKTNGSGDGARAFSSSSTTHLLLWCWPCFAAAGYATMYAYVGGLPLLMTMIFPCAVVICCLLAMCA